MPSSKGSSGPRDQTHVSCVSCIPGGFCTSEPAGKPEYPMVTTSQIKLAMNLQTGSLLSKCNEAITQFLKKIPFLKSKEHVKKMQFIHGTKM